MIPYSRMYHLASSMMGVKHFLDRGMQSCVIPVEDDAPPDQPSLKSARVPVP